MISFGTLRSINMSAAEAGWGADTQSPCVVMTPVAMVLTVKNKRIFLYSMWKNRSYLRHFSIKNYIISKCTYMFLKRDQHVNGWCIYERRRLDTRPPISYPSNIPYPPFNGQVQSIRATTHAYFRKNCSTTKDTSLAERIYWAFYIIFTPQDKFCNM